MSGTLMSISFIVLVAGNLGASGYILSVVLGIPLIYAMLISTAVVLLYTYFGGLFSCAYTDILHIYLAVVGFWAGFIYFIGPWSPIPGGLETIVANVPGNFMDMSGLYDTANGANQLGKYNIIRCRRYCCVRFYGACICCRWWANSSKGFLYGCRTHSLDTYSYYNDGHNWINS